MFIGVWVALKHGLKFTSLRTARTAMEAKLMQRESRSMKCRFSWEDMIGSFGPHRGYYFLKVVKHVYRSPLHSLV